MATAGPSRLPTISTEDEEMAAESGTAVPQSPAPVTSTKIGNNGSTTPSKNQPETAAPVETACETLYIQNLNEKVQVEG